MGEDLVLTCLLPLTLRADPLPVTFAGVEGDEKVGRADEEEEDGACTVICKHLKKIVYNLM